MDLRRLRVGEWLLAIAGVAAIASLWMPWWRLPASAGPAADPTGWQVMTLVDVLLALLGVLALVSWVLVAVRAAPGPGLASEVLLVPYALVVTIVCGVRLLDVPSELEPLPGIAGGASLAFGAWIGFAAAAGSFVASLVAIRDERLSRPGRLTDATGAPTAEPVAVETLPPPPRIAAR